jgi:hypothetical protein
MQHRMYQEIPPNSTRRTVTYAESGLDNLFDPRVESRRNQAYQMHHNGPKPYGREKHP